MGSMAPDVLNQISTCSSSTSAYLTYPQLAMNSLDSDILHTIHIPESKESLSEEVTGASSLLLSTIGFRQALPRVEGWSRRLLGERCVYILQLDIHIGLLFCSILCFSSGSG
jgi:hypothetical protein